MTIEKGQMISIRNNLSRSNEEVRKEIYRALGEESGIDVHVHEGIVRLTGVVDTEESLDFIESTVRELPGVDDVENELTVKIVQ
ncbi:BON domain-containing protein [Bacteriovorax sp. PP10]|uniref:BON domain-containing protein n=1 Tax=Bacteriovorax antarcticus TaxID=3088717 RepID=A0ABU5VYG5_9BACT|nr:BON domain-containing protein [Bacteriovorax sp. PP10]MEA9357359.1 BON domain-containing protein [Bacteriovorax sp. PP10]